MKTSQRAVGVKSPSSKSIGKGGSGNPGLPGKGRFKSSANSSAKTNSAGRGGNIWGKR